MSESISSAEPPLAWPIEVISDLLVSQLLVAAACATTE